MGDAVEFLQKRLEEKEESLKNRKPWHDVEEITSVINSIKSAISELSQETVATH